MAAAAEQTPADAAADCVRPAGLLRASPAVASYFPLQQGMHFSAALDAFSASLGAAASTAERHSAPPAPLLHAAVAAGEPVVADAAAGTGTAADCIQLRRLITPQGALIATACARPKTPPLATIRDNLCDIMEKVVPSRQPPETAAPAERPPPTQPEDGQCLNCQSEPGVATAAPATPSQMPATAAEGATAERQHKPKRKKRPPPEFVAEPSSEYNKRRKAAAPEAAACLPAMPVARPTTAV